MKYHFGTHANPHRLNVMIFHLARISLLGATVLFLPSCENTAPKEPAKFDLVAEPLPLASPALEPLTVLSNTPAVPDSVRESLNLRRAFFAGDFHTLDRVLLKYHEDYVEGRENDSVARRFIAGIQDTQLAGIEPCESWLSAMPKSYPAHWACGAMWQAGARKIRGTNYAKDVSPGQFAIMHERLQRSSELFANASTLHPKPLQTLTMMAANHYLGGNNEEAERLLGRAEQIRSQHLPIHQVRMIYSQPEWGGSAELVQAAYERAKAAGIARGDLLDLEDQHLHRPHKMTTPGAARAYWEKAIGESATQTRLSSLLSSLIDDFIWLENWQAALPVANRLIESHPDDESAYYRRGRINEKLGRITEARNDFQMAAAMGHDLSLQKLILASTRGGLGFTEQSFDAAVELCRYGATLGLGVGANCIGALYQEGGSAGVPFQNDLPQSLAWHLRGARAGHFNSQYDLGWMLYTGRAAGVDDKTAKRIGTFWLRRAAEQGHNFAKLKLDENRISPSEVIPAYPEMSIMQRLLSSLRELVE